MYLQDIIPRLEAADYVYRYSWFITRYNDKKLMQQEDWFVDPINSLFLNGTSQLSEVGKLYNTL